MGATHQKTTSTDNKSSSVVHDSKVYRENIADSFTKKNVTSDFTYDGKFVGKDSVTHGNIYGDRDGFMIVSLLNLN